MIAFGTNRVGVLDFPREIVPQPEVTMSLVIDSIHATRHHQQATQQLNLEPDLVRELAR